MKCIDQIPPPAAIAAALSQAERMYPEAERARRQMSYDMNDARIAMAIEMATMP
jgi:hypothetical protein